MGLLSRLLSAFGREVARQNEERTHDFTFTFEGHGITLVKQLADAFRVFLVGHGPGIVVGDCVVIRAKESAARVRYRIESIRYIDGNWRAYARLEQAVLRKVRLSHETRPQARSGRTEVRRAASPQEVQDEITRVTRRKDDRAPDGESVVGGQVSAEAAPGAAPKTRSVRPQRTTSSASQEVAHPVEG